MTKPMQYEEIEAIVRKGERDERRKRRQFSLRKLLLWTGVAALMLGLLRMLGLGPIVLACIAAWVMVIVGVRLAFGLVVALVFSIAAGSLAGGGLVLADILRGGSFSDAHGIPGLLMVPVWGASLGYVSYVVLEVTCCIIGLPDGLLRSDRYDR